MMILVTGGSGSGKSSYAENRIVNLFDNHAESGIVNLFDNHVEHRMYYLATMKVYGEEGQRKVERHKAMRAGKGFVTIEQTMDIGESLKKMKEEKSTSGPQETGILLECMSNLVANEMFLENVVRDEAQVVEKICQEIALLKAGVDHLVIVTNNVFEDGIRYSQETMAYLRALGTINQKLAGMAEEVWEVVAGIPIRIS